MLMERVALRIASSIGGIERRPVGENLDAVAVWSAAWQVDWIV